MGIEALNNACAPLRVSRWLRLTILPEEEGRRTRPVSRSGLGGQARPSIWIAPAPLNVAPAIAGHRLVFKTMLGMPRGTRGTGGRPLAHASSLLIGGPLAFYLQFGQEPCRRCAAGVVCPINLAFEQDDAGAPLPTERPTRRKPSD
jgi:hypothetical protein